jgi:hypothetical protein
MVLKGMEVYGDPGEGRLEEIITCKKTTNTGHDEEQKLEGVRGMHQRDENNQASLHIIKIKILYHIIKLIIFFRNKLRITFLNRIKLLK